MNQKVSVSLSSKYRLYSIVLSCTIIVIVSVVSIFIETSRYKSEIKRIKEDSLDKKKLEIRNEVMSCISTIDVLRADLTSQMKLNLKNRVDEGYDVALSLYNKHKNTKTKDEIISIIKDALRANRFFNGRGYYFISTLSGIDILNPPKPKSENTNVLEFRDAKGGYPVKNMFSQLDSAESAYVTYYWSEPNKAEFTSLKTSYVRKLPFYNLVLGTGDYLRVLEQDLQNRVLNHISSISYGENGYIFVYNFDGKVLNTNSEVIKVGDNITKFKDRDGIVIYQELYRRAIQKDGGYYIYNGYGYEFQDAPNYISYVKSVNDWEWVVGAFVNSSIIDKMIHNDKEDLYETTFMRLLLVLFIMTLIILVILYLGKKLKEKIDYLFFTFFRELEEAIKSKGLISPQTLRVKEYSKLAEMTNSILIDQREVFNKLENSEQRFRLLIKNVPVMIFGLDEYNRVTILNKESQKFIGKRSADAMGKVFNLDDYFEENEAAKIRNKFKNTKHQFSLRSCKTKTGVDYSHIWSYFKTSKDETIFVGYDITEQVKNEEQINDQKELLETLVETMPLPIFYKNLEGVYQGCNTAYSIFLGKSKNEIIGKTIEELYLDEAVEIMKKKDEELINKGDIQVYESPFLNDKGDVRYGRIYKALYKDHSGNNTGILGISMDITDNINYEKNLEELNKTKDRFFSIIAHDLKNPFNSLLGILDLLKEDYDELDDVERKEYVEILNKTSNRLFRLLTNLLDWSRAQTNSIKFEPKDTNISEIIDDNIKMLQYQAEAKDIKLVSNIQEIIILEADYNMISSVVRNLLNNAIKFTNKGGCVRVYAVKEYDYYKFCVEDNGVGISKENISKLFKIEEKLTTQGTDSEVGTGLGLMLCKEFIEKHGGVIRVESVLGEGAIFSFSLPIIRRS